MFSWLFGKKKDDDDMCPRSPWYAEGCDIPRHLHPHVSTGFTGNINGVLYWEGKRVTEQQYEELQRKNAPNF